MTTTEHKPDPSGLDADPIMSVRPRLGHDVLFADTGEGVVLRKSNDGYVLKGRTAYRFTASLAPFLTGELTVGELCAELGPQRRQMIAEFVRNLIDRGFARDVTVTEPPAIDDAVKARFSSQINYVEHYADDAIARFLRFRSTRTLVLGTGATACAAAQSLLRNGLEAVSVLPAAGARHAVPPRLSILAEELGAVVSIAHDALDPVELAGFDAVIAPADDVGVATLFQLNAIALRKGPAILPAAVVGGRLIAGPLVRPVAAPCWVCALMRLGANSDPAPVAALWRDISLRGVAPAAPLGDQLADMIGNLLAYELFRFTTGSLVPETDGGVIMQDLTTLEVRRERLLAHPLCPCCRDHQRATEGNAITVPELAPDNGFQPVDREEIGLLLNELDELVGQHVGVLTEFADTSLDQSPLKVSRVRMGPAGGPDEPVRLVTSFDLHYLPAARRSAVRAALLAYVGRLASHPGVVGDAGRDGVPPAELTTWIGVPVASPAIESWIPAVSLVTGDRQLVPAAAVYPFSPFNGTPLFERSGAGDGAGSTPAEAAGAGLLSALAFDALTGAARGAAGHRIIVDSAETGSELEFLLRTVANLEMAVELVDLAPGRPYSVVLAVAGAGGSERPMWTIGFALSDYRATVNALRDLIGREQLNRALGRDTEVDAGSPLLATLDVRTVRRDGGLSTVHDTPALPITGVLSDLAEREIDPLVVDTTTPDLSKHGGVVTARVLLRRPSRR